jgi:hypothetical protein
MRRNPIDPGQKARRFQIAGIVLILLPLLAVIVHALIIGKGSDVASRSTAPGIGMDPGPPMVVIP